MRVVLVVGGGVGGAVRGARLLTPTPRAAQGQCMVLSAQEGCNECRCHVRSVGLKEVQAVQHKVHKGEL